MTDEEWERCIDYRHILREAEPRLSPRKKRLLAVALARHGGHLLKDEGALQALDVVERALDRRAAAGELTAARAAVRTANRNADRAYSEGWADFNAAVEAAGRFGDAIQIVNSARAPATAALREARSAFHLIAAAQAAVRLVVAAVRKQAGVLVEQLSTVIACESRASHRVLDAGELRARLGAIVCPLVREVVGPVRRVPRPPAARSVAVGQIARAISDGKTFDELPILADALEEAGCTDAAILGHLRGPGPHMRGCWALDLILAKGG